MNKIRFYVGIILAVIAVFAIIGLLTPPRPIDEFNAQVMCEKFISDRLINPADAHYSHFWDEGMSYSHAEGSPTWTINGWVDATNRFGGKLRQRYTCTVTDQGNDNWHLDNLELFE